MDCAAPTKRYSEHSRRWRGDFRLRISKPCTSIDDLDGAASELIVNSGHSVQRTPQAIAAVKRILLLHLTEAKGR